jgi:hypothetical protein
MSGRCVATAKPLDRQRILMYGGRSGGNSSRICSNISVSGYDAVVWHVQGNQLDRCLARSAHAIILASICGISGCFCAASG